MRIVFDSNVLARAAGPTGPAARALDLILSSAQTLVLSELLLTELARILRYDRLLRIHRLSEAKMDAYVDFLRAASLIVPLLEEWIEPVVAADPDDDVVVATALFGHVDVICTWDKHLHEPDVRRHLRTAGIRVLRDEDLLRELDDRQAA
jgi:predicted nucleic acid-binding protein